MSYLIVNRADKFCVEIDSIASDKSISHRCAIFALLSDKASVIENYLPAEDTMNTLKIVELLGAKVEKKDNIITITPPSLLIEPAHILDCGNSGTAMRLLMGFLASKNGFFVLHGDKYLASRPMKRVADPLRSIGASIDGREGGNLSPIAISGGRLKGFDYVSPIASAQVKSAMILASLNSDEPSFYKESHLSRDHTERMLRGMGVDIVNEGDKIKITPPTSSLKPLDLRVPSDPSSGFFFAVAAAITPDSKVTLKNLSLNPTRIEAYKVLEKMGAKISYDLKEEIYEPIGDITIEYAPLSGVVVEDNIAWLIDELPALSIAMAVAKGRSTIRNAKELRVKESDRIKTVVDNLNICGIKTDEYEDGYEVTGGKFSVGTKSVNSFGDHRIAMSFAIVGLMSKIKIEDVDCIETSFPNFVEILESMTHVESEVEIGD